jgi:hypothetical protein
MWRDGQTAFETPSPYSITWHGLDGKYALALWHRRVYSRRNALIRKWEEQQ